ncbi:MAG: hypothetical protein Q9162_000445 [Coniocarpon cinnabarinum]
MSETRNRFALPYLTESDIELLHEIISRAESAPEKSSRALFEAYDTVLAEHAINRDRDQKYFRFLLRMRESQQRQTKSLIEQFTDLCSTLGIRLVFDGDRASTASQADDEQRFDGHPGINEGHNVEKSNDDTRPRRASFNEFEDSEKLALRAHNLKGHAPLTRSLSEDEIQNALDEPHDPMHLSDTRPNGYAIGPQHEHLASKHTTDSDRQPRKPIVQIREEPSIYEFERSVASDEVSETDEDDSQEFRSSQARPAHNSAQYEREIQAGNFRFRKLAARAHSTFHDWLNKSRASRSSSHRKVEVATKQAGETLRKTALDQWRDQFLARRREKEMHGFFEILENRAGRARDLYLLTRSFSHWAQLASDEILRTSAARRHILRTRFFNAWRDITAVNEFKHSRGLTMAWFAQWVDKTQTLYLHEQQVRHSQERRVLAKAWASLVERRRNLQDMRDQAGRLSIEHIQLPLAEICLARLGVAVLRINSHNELANSIRQRNQEKHFKQMLRRLKFAAEERRLQRSVAPGFPEAGFRVENRGATFTRPNRVANLTGDTEGAPTAPTPAYLHTPMRRTTGMLRTKIPRPPATPASLSVTPFMSRLQAQLPDAVSGRRHGSRLRHDHELVDDDDPVDLSPLRERSEG